MVGLLPAPHTLIPCRAERLCPDVDWTHVWKLARQRYLESDQTSFLFKLLHQLLPTSSRVHRILTNTSPLCSYCAKFGVEMEEDLEHTFFTCLHNREAGEKLVCIVRGESSPTNSKLLLVLNIQFEPFLEFPLTWVISA